MGHKESGIVLPAPQEHLPGPLWAVLNNCGLWGLSAWIGMSASPLNVSGPLGKPPTLPWYSLIPKTTVTPMLDLLIGPSLRSHSSATHPHSWLGLLEGSVLSLTLDFGLGRWTCWDRWLVYKRQAKAWSMPVRLGVPSCTSTLPLEAQALSVPEEETLGMAWT